MKFNIYSILVAFLALAVYSCAPSVKGESQQWEHNQAHATEMSETYPNYSSFIAPAVEAAKTAWAEAEKEADDEKKAEKMQAVNTDMTNGVSGKLYSAHLRIQDVSKKQSKLLDLKLPKAKLAAAQKALDSSYEKIGEVHSKLAETATTKEVALEKVSEATSMLISLNSALDRALRAAKKKKKRGK